MGFRWLMKENEAAWSARSLYSSKFVQRSCRLVARHLRSQSCSMTSKSIHFSAPASSQLGEKNAQTQIFFRKEAMASLTVHAFSIYGCYKLCSRYRHLLDPT